MLTLQEISDRLEIQQLAVDYANAIDGRHFDGLDAIFTPDAYIDYRAFGGIDGRYPEVKLWLRAALARLPAFQHLVGNMDIKVSGDQGTGRILCLNPVAVPLKTGGVQVGFYGLWYVDTYVRSQRGWRIATRGEERSFDHNLPVQDGSATD
jgi:SnoaL-like domain